MYRKGRVIGVTVEDLAGTKGSHVLFRAGFTVSPLRLQFTIHAVSGLPSLERCEAATMNVIQMDPACGNPNQEFLIPLKTPPENSNEEMSVLECSSNRCFFRTSRHRCKKHITEGRYLVRSIHILGPEVGCAMATCLFDVAADAGLRTCLAARPEERYRNLGSTKAGILVLLKHFAILPDGTDEQLSHI
ncbi:uncharacterized protein BT62DRAFT_999575 [Guyanagaster necrorhizus]|uniref:Uncharacterized protein n=1 Tax=Guyanagaster necrorhizus TaxID=856835 RepID=A0A9P7W468_9AGAR|nr:uncharacterized protein BT62DRAFT_999575 [Guyanagaster necrorhizus MCA 3950]KAG7451853.1 hypothetical protein BT62DRAFT_999575 [Guyanagaster necrorhizus MCA 3950]